MTIYNRKRPEYALAGKPKIFRDMLPEPEAGNYEFLAEAFWDIRGAVPSTPLARDAVNLHGNILSVHHISPFLMKALKGSVLVDLGAGDPSGMYRFAGLYGVQHYIAVDYAYGPSFCGSAGDVLLIGDDLLNFLIQLRDRTVNVCMNAIDRSVLYENIDRIGTFYTSALMYEIARVVPANGLAFGISSPCLHYLSEHGFNRVDSLESGPVGDLSAVYQKPDHPSASF